MNFSLAQKLCLIIITQFLDKGIQNNSAAESFNRAKQQYLIKRGKKVKRSKIKENLKANVILQLTQEIKK